VAAESFPSPLCFSDTIFVSYARMTMVRLRQRSTVRNSSLPFQKFMRASSFNENH
jgi:hypothetical protein